MKRAAVSASLGGVIVLVLALVIGIYWTVTANPGSPAPWFGTPLFTLAGAVSGAFIAGGFGLWLEYQKREADHLLADSTLQREASVEFLSQIVRYFNKAYSPHTRVSDEAVMTSWTSLQLICDKRQIKPAQALLHAATYFVPLRRTHVDADDHACESCDDDPYIDEALKWYQHCKLAFSNELRQQHGIDKLPDLPYDAKEPDQLAEKVRKDMEPRQFLDEEISEFLEAKQAEASEGDEQDSALTS